MAEDNNEKCTQMNEETNEIDTQLNENDQSGGESQNNEKGENNPTIKDTDNSNRIKIKRRVPGVMYLSSLPPNMNALHLQQIFEKYGEVGRIFLQPDERKKKSGKLKFAYNSGTYTEGWVEMGDKKLARRLAETLNSTQIVEGKKKKFAEFMWNIKYLSKFRWTHLTERLAYEKAVYQQKMRTESAQARRETEAFIANVEASKKFASIKERKEKKGVGVAEKRKVMEFKQRKTVEELQKEKAKKMKTVKREDVLSKIFGGT